jgi:hypothetical protein
MDGSGKHNRANIERSIRNASDILDDQVLIRLQIVGIVKHRFNKKKGMRMMKQVKKAARKFKGNYDIAIAYTKLPRRKFMGKCGGKYILIRSEPYQKGIVTAHEIGHSFLDHKHDKSGLMSAKAFGRRGGPNIPMDTAFRWKNNRWKSFN